MEYAAFPAEQTLELLFSDGTDISDRWKKWWIMKLAIGWLMRLS